MKTAKKVVSLALICFMLISTMLVSVPVLAAEPTNIHNIDFENYDVAVYENATAAKALTCFESIGNLFGKANAEIVADSQYGNVFRITKIANTATLYAGDGCFYIPALNGNGNKISKSAGKLVVEFDQAIGRADHWRSGLHITPYPVSGNSVFNTIVLQDNNAGNGISGTSHRIKDTAWHHWKIEFDIDAKTYSVDLDGKNALNGNVAFPDNAAEANIASYKIGIDMSIDYVSFDNFTTYYIAPPTSEDLEALASVKCADSQIVGNELSVTPVFSTANVVSASLYFGDTLISDAVESGVPVSYTIPADTALGIYDINLIINYTGDRMAVKSKTIEVCPKGSAINKNVIDFEDFEIAEYTNANSANAALAPLCDFNSNMFSRTPISIIESTEGDGHGKILAMNKVTSQINVGNGSFLVPANIEDGSVKGVDSGKVNFEFDLKFLQNWKYGLHITPVSANKQNGSGSYVIMENCQVGSSYISSESEKWLRVKLTFDLDKKVYYGSVGNYPVNETAFTLNSADPTLAYFKLDNPTTGAATVVRYVHFDNFTTSYNPPIVYSADELKAFASVKVAGSQRAGNVVTFTPYYEVAKFESASLYIGDTLISDSVALDKPAKYFIPSNTAEGDYTLKLKMNYTGIGEVVKEQTFTVYSKDDAYNNVNVIDFENYAEATYTSTDAAKAITEFNTVNTGLFNFADVSIATDEQKGKVYRISKTKREGESLYAGNGSTYFPSLYENGEKQFKREGRLDLEFDFAFSNNPNWATTLMVSPLSKSGYCVFDVKLITGGGEIPGTGRYIQDTNWHHAKVIFDMDTDTYSAWVDDIQLPDGAMRFQSAAEHNTYSYRIGTQFYDMGWYTSIDNIKTAYIPSSVYKNTVFTKASADHATAGLIDSDAEAIKINVNKEYNASVASKVKVMVNGTEKAVEAAYASKTITIPLASLALSEGDKVDVYVAYDALLADNTEADELIALSYTVAGTDGYIFNVENGKAKAVFEIDSYVPNGTVCYVASYEGNKLVGLVPTTLAYSPKAKVCETEEIVLPASYDEVKCFVFASSVKPLITAIVK